MSERDHSGGGGLTGATGDLTFEENDRPLITGEAREVSDPAHRADVTAAQVPQAPAQQGGTGEPTEERRPWGGEPASSSSPRGDEEARIGGDQLADREEHF